MRIVITGGAGYVGSHTARILAQRGHSVALYDNLSTGFASLAKGFELTVGDIGDKPSLLRVLRGAGAVMHFAASASVAESIADPGKYFDNNLCRGICLLDALQQARVPYLVFSSSCTVYGDAQQSPIREEVICAPVNAYGATKLYFEGALKSYEQAAGPRFVALRYFNAAGADESGEIGEMHNPETHLIPIALDVAAGWRPELVIHGTDYATPDGTCVRDYVHVNDLAEAHALALDYLLAGGRSTVMNLGSGAGYSVKEIVAAIQRQTGRVLNTTYGPRRPGDVGALVADPSRAQKLLQWRASRSLEQMIATAWNWHTRRKHCEDRTAAENTELAGSRG